MIALLPLLADISAQDVGQIIAALLACGGVSTSFYYAGKAKAVHIQPQPLEVTATKEFVTRQEMREELGKLSQRIDMVTTSSARIEGKIDQIAITQQQILKSIIRHE